MNFCSKCGYQMSEDANVCPNCGCASSKATAEQLDNHPIVKNSTGQLFMTCMLGGVVFGAVMGIMWSAMGMSFVLGFLICSVVFGLLMFGAMAVAVKVLNNNSRKNIMKKVAMSGQIYFEGAANRSGNGGWLFVTQNAVEHHVHNTNIDTKSTIMPHDEIISIYKSGKKLSVKTTKTTYTFVVNNINEWMSLFAQCELTKNKLN